MTADREVECESCGRVETVGLDAHETWDGDTLHFWCAEHCPECASGVCIMTTCAEAVVDRDGVLVPCGEPSTGWGVDPMSLYPACDIHATDTGRVMRLAVEMLWALRAMDPVVGATVRAVTEAEIAHSQAVLDWARNRGIGI